MKIIAAIATATLIALSAATAASANGKASLHTSGDTPAWAVEAFNSQK